MAILQEIKVPLVSVNDTSLTVVERLFSNGDYVKKNDIVLVFETSKTTYDVIVETDGYIQYLCEPANDYSVNEIVAKVFSDLSDIEKIVVAEPVSNKNGIHVLPAAMPVLKVYSGNTLFSSSALLLIESAGIDYSLFVGKDLVSKHDVEELTAVNGKTLGGTFKSGKKMFPDQKSGLQIDVTKVIIENLSSNKKKEIRYLEEVQSAGLTSTVNTIVETEDIFVHMNQSLQFLKNSLLPVIVYETGRLLQKYTRLNAWFTGDGTAFYKEVNVGFAIDIDKGLKVLKVADTPKKSIIEIEENIISLSGKYLDDTLESADLSDITFTITDLSSEGVTFFTPLVNRMNSAILGISSVDRKLNRCILSVTFDHRVTEGKMAAQFLNDLKSRLESYRSAFHPNLNKIITCFKCLKALTDDLSDVGFAKCITPQGNEAFICQSCLKGF